MRYMKASLANGTVTEQFKERTMLAVTEVNACPMCSYAHTKMALESDMTKDEINAMLVGTLDDTPPDELPGVLFAQHYADMRAKPSKSSWQRLLQDYGKDKANGILGVTRTIMLGNAYGIVIGSIKGRFKGEPDKRSSLVYELGMLLTLPPFMLIAFLHVGIARLLRMPLISFESKTNGTVL